jgi:hypothetical protein
MPIVVVESLSLPIVSTTRVVGVSGASRANIHAAFLEAAGSRTMAEVVALGAEAILGRDMANHWILALDGPGRLLEVRPGPRRARRR